MSTPHPPRDPGPQASPPSRAVEAKIGLYRLDTSNRVEVDGVSRLHEEYLSDSSVVTLGPRFLREFYYVDLVNDGLIECVTCHDESGIIGFLSFTHRPNDFMVEGLKHNFVKIAWILLRSVLARPAMLKEVLFIARAQGERSQEARDESVDDLGEALSLAIPPKKQKFVPPGGKGRMTAQLFDAMVDWFRTKGIRRIRFNVNPNNRAANILYASIGAKFEKVDHAGLTIHRFTYEIPPQEPSKG